MKTRARTSSSGTRAGGLSTTKFPPRGYPGNVIGLARNVRPISIIFARLVDEAGSPIANAFLEFEGATIGTTGQDGYFQIDASPGDLILARQSVGESCETALPPNSNPTDVYIDAGTLTCQ